MADTRRSLSALQTLLADNTTGAISPQDVRDLLVSASPPYGSIYVSTAAATTIAASSTYYKAAGTTTSTNLKEFDMPANNRLRYTGAADIHIHGVVTVALTTASSSQVIGLRVGKNGSASGTDSVASQVEHKTGTGTDVISTAIHVDTMLSTNDYLELWVANETTGSNLTIEFMYFFVMGMLT